MGLKYVETIKSLVLGSLIVLSLTLTFSIWTHTPNYDTMEQLTTVEIAIADKRELEAIVKPYKLLFNFEEGLRGTTNSDEIDYLISTLKNWKISDLELEDENFGNEELDAFLRKKNRFTLFFQGEVPLYVYKNVLSVEEKSIPEVSFDRIIVDWNSSQSAMTMHFISRKDRMRYSAKVKAVEPQILLSKGLGYETYVEANPRQTTRFIAVPENRVELIQNTYNERETSLSKFRDALFSDRNAVRRNQVGLNREEFQDDHALMSIDKTSKRLHYVHQVAESNEPAIPSELLKKTIDFMNEHGGWTDEFRFSYIDPVLRNVKFQLYVHGLPVFSSSTPTEIDQVWGDDRIFRYMRPYYTLDLTLPYETETVSLISGVEVVEMLMRSEEIDFNTVEEITLAYFMKHDRDHGIFLLEPSWYYLIKGEWKRFSPELLGGDQAGLE